MSESAEDQTQGAVNASQPGSTKPSRPEVRNKGTKWDNAPGVVGEDEGKTGQEDAPKPGSDPAPQPVAAGQHPPEGEAQLQEGVTEPAGTVHDAGQQDEGEFKPARAENDEMHNDPAAKPSPEPQPGLAETAGPGKFDPMFRDDRDHPHFAGPKAQEHGDYDKSGAENDGQKGGNVDWTPEGIRQREHEVDIRQVKMDGREAGLDAREADVARREQAVQPTTATITDRDVDAQIIGESYVDGATAFGQDPNLDDGAKQALGSITLCALRLRHGGVVIGSAEGDGQTSTSPQTVRQAARADARDQIDTGLRFAHRMKVAGI